MIKKLAANVKEFKGDAVLAPIFVALEVVLDVLIPYVMSIIIDRGIKVGNMQIVWFYGGFLIAAAVLSLCFVYRENMRRAPPQALPAICVKIFITESSRFRFPTSIVFQRPD